MDSPRCRQQQQTLQKAIPSHRKSTNPLMYSQTPQGGLSSAPISRRRTSSLRRTPQSAAHLVPVTCVHPRALETSRNTPLVSTVIGLWYALERGVAHQQRDKTRSPPFTAAAPTTQIRTDYSTPAADTPPPHARSPSSNRVALPSFSAQTLATPRTFVPQTTVKLYDRIG